MVITDAFLVRKDTNNYEITCPKFSIFIPKFSISTNISMI